MKNFGNCILDSPFFDLGFMKKYMGLLPKYFSPGFRLCIVYRPAYGGIVYRIKTKNETDILSRYVADL